MNKLDTTGWSKEKLEAYEQAQSKLELEKDMQYNLEELLKKSPMDITHSEMMFVLENMNLEQITAAAMERQNLQIKKSNENNERGN